MRALAGRRLGIIYERQGFAFLLNAPALLAIVILVGYPIAYSAWISIHKYNLQHLASGPTILRVMLDPSQCMR
jgi:ABC-type sugar transport system permease subunit